MSDAQLPPNTSNLPQCFEISWDEHMGYRVSVPCLLVPGQRIEVVEVAALFTDDAIDRAAAAWWGHDGSDKEVARDAMRAALRAAIGMS